METDFQHLGHVLVMMGSCIYTAKSPHLPQSSPLLILFLTGMLRVQFLIIILDLPMPHLHYLPNSWGLSAFIPFPGVARICSAGRKPPPCYGGSKAVPLLWVAPYVEETINFPGGRGGTKKFRGGLSPGKECRALRFP